MNNSFPNDNSGVLDYTKDASIQRRFFSSVFTYMAVGLAISFALSYVLSGSGAWFSMLFGYEGIKPLGYVVMFAPLVLTLIMGGLMEKLSTLWLSVLFAAFAVVMGMSMSTIFVVYTASSIATVFAITAVTFGLFAVLGYTTKADLTKLGMICAIGFGALILVSLANFFFFESEKVSYWMSGIGVILVIGLIAYKVQHLKNIAAGIEYGTAEFNKRALIGAFMLYMSFISLFLMLLRLFGSRD